MLDGPDISQYILLTQDETVPDDQIACEVGPAVFLTGKDLHNRVDRFALVVKIRVELDLQLLHLTGRTLMPITSNRSVGAAVQPENAIPQVKRCIGRAPVAQAGDDASDTLSADVEDCAAAILRRH